MTTNVIDLISGVVASDSRWSISGKDFLIYLDNSGFEKIFPLKGSVCIFSGNGKLIDLWEKWLSTKPKNRTGHPPTSIDTPNGVQSVTLNLILRTTSKLRFTRGQTENLNKEAFFAGTGTFSAMSSWIQDKDARNAVTHAIGSDMFSGGEVKYFTLKCGSNNLRQSVSFEEMNKLVGKEGLVMYLNKGSAPVPVSVAAQSDSNVLKIQTALEAGSVAASAPCSSMYTQWTEEEINQLGDALDEILALEE